MSKAAEKYPHLHAAKKRHIDRGPLAFSFLFGELVGDEVTGYSADRSRQIKRMTPQMREDLITAAEVVVQKLKKRVAISDAAFEGWLTAPNRKPVHVLGAQFKNPHTTINLLDNGFFCFLGRIIDSFLQFLFNRFKRVLRV